MTANILRENTQRKQQQNKPQPHTKPQSADDTKSSVDDDTKLSLPLPGYELEQYLEHECNRLVQVDPFEGNTQRWNDDPVM